MESACVYVRKRENDWRVRVCEGVREWKSGCVCALFKGCKLGSALGEKRKGKREREINTFSWKLSFPFLLAEDPWTEPTKSW